MRIKETLVQFASKSSGLYTPPSSSLIVGGALVLFMEFYTRQDFFILYFFAFMVLSPCFIIHSATFDIIFSPFPVAYFLSFVGLLPVFFVIYGHLFPISYPL